MLKSEDRKRSDSSLLRGDSAFGLRSPIYFTAASRPSMSSDTHRWFAIELISAVDACFARATEVSSYVQ
jgi:hypothetical protein